MVECRYRGRVIGWLIEGPDGFLRYSRNEVEYILPNGSWTDWREGVWP